MRPMSGTHRPQPASGRRTVCPEARGDGLPDAALADAALLASACDSVPSEPAVHSQFGKGSDGHPCTSARVGWTPTTPTLAPTGLSRDILAYSVCGVYGTGAMSASGSSMPIHRAARPWLSRSLHVVVVLLGLLLPAAKLRRRWSSSRRCGRGTPTSAPIATDDEALLRGQAPDGAAVA